MDVRGKADLRDRPQKIKSNDLVSDMLRSPSRETVSRNRAQTSCKASFIDTIKKGADSSNRPKLSLSYVLQIGRAHV